MAISLVSMMWPLEVKPSTIKGVGNGVFALVDIPGDCIVGIYDGRHFPPGCPTMITENIYCYEKTDGSAIVPGKDCILRYINDIIDLEETKRRNKRVNHPYDYNVDFVELSKDDHIKFFPKDEVVVSTLRPIKAGDELFIDYGPDYWSRCDGGASKRKILSEKVRKYGDLARLITRVRRIKERRRRRHLTSGKSRLLL